MKLYKLKVLSLQWWDCKLPVFFCEKLFFCVVLAITGKAAIDVGESVPCWSFLDKVGGQCKMFAYAEKLPGCDGSSR